MSFFAASAAPQATAAYQSAAELSGASVVGSAGAASGTSVVGGSAGATTAAALLARAETRRNPADLVAQPARWGMPWYETTVQQRGSAQASTRAALLAEAEAEAKTKAKAAAETSLLRSLLAGLGTLSSLGVCISFVTSNTSALNSAYHDPMQHFATRSGIFEVATFNNPTRPGIQTIYIAQHETREIVAFNLITEPLAPRPDSPRKKIENIRKVSKDEIEEALALSTPLPPDPWDDGEPDNVSETDARSRRGSHDSRASEADEPAAPRHSSQRLTFI